MNVNYTVSVRLMTFNHTPFIKDAMEGILMQKTNFPVEVVIGDDFSTDRTLSIIKKYKSTKNIHLKILDRKKGDDYWIKRQEKGRLYNFTNILENCSGKYIALLDGDDYWVDPLKLQKQVDFLEVQSDVVACFTNAIFLNEITKEEKRYIKDIKEGEVKVKDVILKGGGIYPTASLMFKNGVVDLDIFNILPELNGDDLLINILSTKGKVYFLDHVTCVYRRWEGGIYSSIHKNIEKLIQAKKRNIIGMNKYNTLTNYKYNKYIQRKISLNSVFLFKRSKGIGRLKHLFKLHYKDLIKLLIQ